MPKIGLVLGSGIGPLADEIENAQFLDYHAVPHMKASTAPDHKGRFVCGTLAGKNVLCMQGRLHGYEGYEPADISYPIRMMRLAGVQTLILTNASGGIQTEFSVGDLMVIDDQINLTGKSPLTGANDHAIGLRFPDMTALYTPELRALADRCAEKCGITIQHGVYIGVNGPQFETPAEIRAFRTLGADAVGMSTVFEAIAAAHCGLKTLGIAMITNMAAGVSPHPLSGEEVNRIAEEKGPILRRLLREIITALPE